MKIYLRISMGANMEANLSAECDGSLSNEVLELLLVPPLPLVLNGGALCILEGLGGFRREALILKLDNKKGKVWATCRVLEAVDVPSVIPQAFRPVKSVKSGN